MSKKIQLFKEYVALNLHVPTLVTDTIAQEIHVSRSTLFRLTKRELKMSPYQYIKQEKLKKALNLLEEGVCQDAKALANAVGYKRVDYFINIFKIFSGIDLYAHFDKS